MKLICNTCGKEYEKPDWWKDYLNDLFFKWSYMYCDKCRRKKELKALKKHIRAIEKNIDSSTMI